MTTLEQILVAKLAAYRQAKVDEAWHGQCFVVRGPQEMGVPGSQPPTKVQAAGRALRAAINAVAAERKAAVA